MSKPRGRRTAAKQKQQRTHVLVEDTWGYEEKLFALAGDMLDKMAPAPSQHVAGRKS